MAKTKIVNFDDPTLREDKNNPNITSSNIYEGTTTTGAIFQNLSAPPIITKTVENDNPDLHVITPLETRTTFMAGKWYNFVRGVQMAVPLAIKSQLATSRLILERDDDPNDWRV
ncbi:MAG: hypothetical protein AABY07_10935 [Nanoarchaeota archaeon]